MRKKTDLLWLLFLLVSVSLAVAWTPYEIALPRPRLTPAPYRSGTTSETFSFTCSGSRHGKAYSGFNIDAAPYPQYKPDQGLIDHP